MLFEEREKRRDPCGQGQGQGQGKGLASLEKKRERERQDALRREREEKEYIAAGLSFSAIGTVGLGVGVLFNGLLTSIAITPEQRGTLIGIGLLGFALVESALLFAMICGFACLFM